MINLQYRRMGIIAIVGMVLGLVPAALLWDLQDVPAMAGLAARFSPGIAWLLYLVLAAAFAWSYVALFNPTATGYVESTMTGVVYGIFWWLLTVLLIQPVLAGQGPQWQIQQAVLHLPALVIHLIQGAGVGLGTTLVLNRLPLPAVSLAEPQEPPVRHRIVIVGGGFAGVTTAQQLEHLLRGDEQVEIILVSETNYLLFTPLLSEVAGGSVEAQHTSTPLRTFFQRTRVIRDQVRQIDLDEQVVHLTSTSLPHSSQLPYDHLVLAVGTVPHFFGNQDLESHAFRFKGLADAVRLRNHVIDVLERADATSDAQQRRQLLTFVVAGGGFAGAELVGSLNDFVRSSLHYYPNIRPDEVSLILVHSRERILPELSPALAAFAQRRLAERGVDVKLQVKVKSAVPGQVLLDNDETIPAETLVWTAGNRAHPLVADLEVATGRGGRIPTDGTLAVPGHAGLWAVGDCASVPNRRTGEEAPPTAQHATREATTLAHNLYATLRGQDQQSFSYRSAGSLAVLGHHTACAELYGMQFSGMLAWWMWRAVYLGKLPTLQKKMRVALDWIVDLFFPRDIVQTGSVGPMRAQPAHASAPPEERPSAPTDRARSDRLAHAEESGG